MDYETQSCPQCDFARWSNINLRISICIVIDDAKVIEYLKAPRGYLVLPNVRASSASGCLGCRILVAACEFALRDRPSATIMGFYCNKGDTFIKANWNDWSEDADLKRHDFDVFTPPGFPMVPRIAVMPEVPRNTHPPYSAPQIKDWLSKCVSTHSLCEQSECYLPPRLLDLRAVDSSQTMRLLDSSASNISGAAGEGRESSKLKYACLSHCWGNTRSVHLTTKVTIAANREGIPISELPLTFRDAVEICRALDIDYLWIDCFCIIQGDADDWKDHVNLMTEIYQNAYLTFGAGASRNSKGGMFRDARYMSDEDESVAISGQSVDYELRFRKRFVHWFEPEAYFRPERGLPLLGRGWVLQEYLLSPRFVAFGQQEIAWACYESRSCSCGPTTSIQNPIECRNDDDESDPLHNELKARVAGINGMDAKDIRNLWSEIVNVYSQMELTKPEDKLPAIAGIARFFKHFLDEEYLGGIWQQDLPRGLLWDLYRAHMEPLPILPEKRRARSLPSWTWASATDEGKVNYSPSMEGIPEEIPLFEVIGVNVDQSRGEFVDLASGSLTIKGTLLPMSIKIDPDKVDFESLELVEDWRESVEKVSHTEWSIGPWDRFLELDYRIGSDLDAANQRLAEVVLLLTTPECGSPRGIMIEGLVLIQVDGPDDNEQRRPRFERIGKLQYNAIAKPAESDKGEIESLVGGDPGEIDPDRVRADWGGTRVPPTVFDFI